MLTWGKIAVITISIFLCAGTVAFCDYTIINEIVRLRKVFKKLTIFLTALLEKEEE